MMDDGYELVKTSHRDAHAQTFTQNRSSSFVKALTPRTSVAVAEVERASRERLAEAVRRLEQLGVRHAGIVARFAAAREIHRCADLFEASSGWSVARLVALLRDGDGSGASSGFGVYDEAAGL